MNDNTLSQQAKDLILGLMGGDPDLQAQIVNGLYFSGGGGTPGGSNTQVQFNNSGAFAGNADLTFNSSTGTLSTKAFNFEVSGTPVITESFNNSTSTYTMTSPNKTGSISSATMEFTTGTTVNEDSGSFVFLTGGTTGSGSSGLIQIQTGTNTSTGFSGGVQLGTGNSSGPTGTLTLYTGSPGAGQFPGNIVLTPGSDGVNNFGQIVLQGGPVVFGQEQNFQVIGAGDTIFSDTSYNEISSSGAVSTSTSVPITAGFQAGQLLILVNTGSHTITIKSGGNTILPGATDYALAANGSISFVWASIGNWITTAASVN